MTLKLCKYLLFTLAALGTNAAFADQVEVAVAANFTAPMKKIVADFDRDTGDRALLSFASTGSLYAQIKNGAPFEVFLSADQATPAKLVKEGMAVAGSQKTYAIGKLVLWSAKPGVVRGKAALRSKTAHVAYCNPTLAPYGAAAVEAMKSLGLYSALKPKLVEGENIAQAYQFVASGNAEIGFVALSQVFKHGRIGRGSGWILPQRLYSPIRQDMVLLDKGKSQAAAKALIRYLGSAKAKAIIRAYGYAL